MKKDYTDVSIEDLSNEDPNLDNLKNRNGSIPFSNTKFLLSHKKILILIALSLTGLFPLIIALNRSLNNEFTTSLSSIQSKLQTMNTDIESQINTQNQFARTVYSLMKTTKVAPAPVNSRNNDNDDILSDPNCPAVDFYEIAMKHGTDKVTTHSYHNMYSKYFAPIRCKPIKIMEIGLGCDMYYGPGASYYLWLDYFPNAEIYFIEYDAKCAEQWKDVDKRVQIFAGDQANITFLQEFIKKTGGEFDFIIDDGGHTMEQQIISLENLIYAVKDGGIYFLEDLLTSFYPKYNGNMAIQNNTTLNYISDILVDIMARYANITEPRKSISRVISDLDCMDEVCAFRKRK